ncbi:MAG: UDP-glucose/GDP-mannose dehydrogenase family protein [Gemmatimonadetes bacterium]|uniref:UDP-glucose 6-dehydrogenase n=1 Tax=Candidatus Kutchimonas denitrificans TaxID=3056748 RepID=A0AAE4Z9C9_9BACT|nr:UDP-glucose/GDP-mannose dehydrogenase family protein [Gemmatimonadota bacterium]NIR73886.1 UDP-glucose/GDP-mannose dehydrogenase family protein [Candidatus Kutchimonas denitrificans]NIR99692.1 UDP-glucose/GDP-mannose dehydrogenase family protein [Gemmatimonadota bacterium]NIT65277.1 UDP-glucose/GDP-mannose dehydrogenase family protein [Gemmatimonadota bacterium]NIW73726.1 nucleotide sugar dehydrogenase [Gemmatimonadota bacterium]
MHIGVIGTGYVGLVAGACLAETGNEVVCGDVDEGKIDALRAGQVPIYEPGLEPLVERNVADGRLRFTTDIPEVTRDSEIIFIAVGTPPDEDGSADLRHVLDVAAVIGDSMNGEKIVVTKSTVPVGTARRVRETIEGRTDHPVHVCSNPEFLKEGAAIDDFMRPDRVVLGVDSEKARDVLAGLYEPFVRTGNPIIFMDIVSAELTKYVANGMLATRISFMNEVARMCELFGADVSLVRRGVGSDTRIGPTFLFPGPGYGGSCFPKDVKALLRTAEEYGYEFRILKAVEEVNRLQKRLYLEKLERHFAPEGLQGKTIGVWGLAFKPGTDDMRESPSIVLVEGLLERGATVRGHDPAAMGTARRIFGDRIVYCDRDYAAVEEADALVVMTDWLEYRRPNFERIRKLMSSPVVFDARNLYDIKKMRDMGFTYYPLGREAVT